MVLASLIPGLLILSLFLAMLTQSPRQEEEERVPVKIRE